MARRILNRKEMRADFDEAERRRTDEEQDEAEDEDEDEDEEEGEEGEGEEGEGEEGEEEEEEAVAKPKKPAKPKPKPKAKPKSRSRAAKTTRQRVIWGVFNNSHQQVATYEYKRKEDALAHAAKLTADKKSTHFVQPVKEPIEEKQE